jgi:hypothetical protein
VLVKGTKCSSSLKLTCRLSSKTSPMILFIGSGKNGFSMTMTLRERDSVKRYLNNIGTKRDIRQGDSLQATR